MSEPQSPVISESSAHYAVLVLKGVEPSRENRAALAAIPQRVEEVAALDSGVRLESLVALGPGAYAAMSPSSRPGSLRPFEPLRGRRHVAPATQGDVLVFLQSSRRDLVFEAMLRVRRTLPRGATSIEEIHGFRYLENRDLSGFKDGSANPPP